MEILRNLNLQFKILNLKIIIFILPTLVLLVVSCSKKPAELYNDGMKSFASGNYEKAQENFADGIKKNGSDSLYAGFIAANLVTGKYSSVNSAYNDFSDGIHNIIIRLYGPKAVRALGIAKELIPYKAEGGNKLPADFPQTIAIQAVADRDGFFVVKQQIDKIIKK